MGKNPYLEHSWGKTAEQKRKESEYNRRYYEQHKRDKWGVGVNSNRPLAREKNVAEGGTGVERRGEGLGTSVNSNRPLARQKNVTEGGVGVNRRRVALLEGGSVGPDHIPPSEVLQAVQKKKRELQDQEQAYSENKARADVYANTYSTKQPSSSEIDRQIALNKAAKAGTQKKTNKMNPYKAYGMADNEATKSYMKGTPSPSQIEAHKTVAKNKDRRAASSAARSTAAAESEQARMSVSEAKIRKRNASIERAAAAAASAQASQNKAAERYKDYEKSGLFKKQEADKRAEAEKQAQYQNRQNELKKAISKKNTIQSEITNINNSIKRLQKEDPKGNAVKIDNLYKQLDQKKEAYKNMQAYINALNF